MDFLRKVVRFWTRSALPQSGSCAAVEAERCCLPKKSALSTSPDFQGTCPSRDRLLSRV